MSCLLRNDLAACRANTRRLSEERAAWRVAAACAPAVAHALGARALLERQELYVRPRWAPRRYGGAA